MVNIRLFSTKEQQAAVSCNEAGGAAYELSHEEALAQYVMTGCFNNVFYTSANNQLATVLELANKVDSQFIAQLAVYARRHAYMKDSPALLLALLSQRDIALFHAIFDRVIDNAKMLKIFVQIMRSGVTGRKSLGAGPKKRVVRWLQARSAQALLNASIGNAPSLADVIKMVHPKPVNSEQEALFAYLIGKPYQASALPDCVLAYEAYKAGDSQQVPKVDFRLLTALNLGTDEWSAIAMQANWQMTRMNLNTFHRHGCFVNQAVIQAVEQRLSNRALINKAKAFPYQLMTAYYAATDVPSAIRNALQDAMEIALENVPRLACKTYVLIDVSGSMQWPVTGYQAGATSQARCIDVAALFAAALLKTGEDVEVMPFDTRVHKADLNPRDSAFTIAKQLAAYGGGGTACGLPLAELNRRKAKGDAVIYFSDNESWADRQWGHDTKVSDEWKKFKHRNPGAKLVLTDLQPYTTTQAQTDASVLNVGGFSDQVFRVIASFLEAGNDKEHWSRMIKKSLAAA